MVDTTETSRSSLLMVLGKPVMLIDSKVLRTGETLLGVSNVTLVGAVVTPTDFALLILPLTLTVKVAVVVPALYLLVKHLI